VVVMVLGLTLIAAIAAQDLLKGLIAGAFGLMIGAIGIDPVFGTPRANFGFIELYDGVTLIPAVSLRRTGSGAVDPGTRPRTSGTCASGQGLRRRGLVLGRGTAGHQASPHGPAVEASEGGQGSVDAGRCLPGQQVGSVAPHVDTSRAQESGLVALPQPVSEAGRVPDIEAGRPLAYPFLSERGDERPERLMCRVWRPR
jgi:hypothetical protein